MKLRFLLSILFYFLFLNANAQNWSCFPQHQQGYYQVNQAGSVKMLVQDSVKINGSQQILFFNRHLEEFGDSICSNSIHGAFIYSGLDDFDSLEINSDTVLFHYGSSSAFFLPNSHPGDAWAFITFALINFSCDSVTVDSSFGLPDSLKYFHTTGGIATQQYVLSKRFGFLHFTAFQNLIFNFNVQTFHLIGIKDSTGEFGFRAQHFPDYFPYHAGDVLKWNFVHSTNHLPFVVSFSFTFFDSILSVTQSPNSFSYIADRIELDTANQVLFMPGGKTYSFNDFGYLLNAAPGSAAISDMFSISPGGKGLFSVSYYDLVNDTVQQNYSIERFVEWSYNDLDSNCFVGSVSDGDYESYLFDTHLGVMSHVFDNQAFTEQTTLIAARINGNVYGNPQLFIGIDEIDQSRISIYPNPVADKLLIKNNNSESATGFSILNLQGQEILSEKFIVGNSIDVSKLTAGIYFIKIFFSKGIITKKFLKID